MVQIFIVYLIRILAKMLWHPYIARVLSVEPSDLIRYYPLLESSGAAAKDFTKNDDGVYANLVLANENAIDGNEAPNFVPASVPSVDIKTNLDGDMSKIVGTIMIHFKVSGSGVWTDGQGRRLFILQSGRSIFLWKLSGNNLLEFKIFNSNILINPISTTDWCVMFCTWDAGAANEIELFCDGVSQGTDTMPDITGQTYSTAAIGSDADLSGNHWDGWLAHFAMWKKVLTLDQIKYLSKI